MCLLTFLPDGVMPDPDALHRGAERNPDGHGLAIVAGDQLIVRRGMSPHTMIDKLVRLRRRYPAGPALFHSRLATHGTRSLANCHPFAVDGDRRTVLAHNGILPSRVQPTKADPRSDTRIAAEEFRARFGPPHQARVRRRLERWITPFNRIVILTVDPAFTRQAFILNEHAGTWHDGTWYSNHDYQPEPPRGTPRKRTAHTRQHTGHEPHRPDPPWEPDEQSESDTWQRWHSWDEPRCPDCGDPVDPITGTCPWRCWTAHAAASISVERAARATSAIHTDMPT